MCLSDPGSCVVGKGKLVSKKKPDLERFLKSRWLELCHLFQIMAIGATYLDLELV